MSTSTTSPAPHSVNPLTAPERTDLLLKQMPARRPILLSVLDHCTDPRSQEDVANHIEKLQALNHSVFSAASLCSLLEEAGALEKVTAEGEPCVQSSPKPQVVVVDGVKYLEPAAAPILYWRTTDTGRAALACNAPATRLRSMLEKDAFYLPIYERILTLCDADGGAATAELGREVDHDPLVQTPRYFAQRFIERLESCEALAWDGSWHTTDLGREALEALASNNR